MSARRSIWQITSEFMYGDQPACTCLVTIDRRKIHMSAFHHFSSVSWKVIKGKGYVVYQQKDGDWALGHLWKGQVFRAYLDHCYYFLPTGKMTLEATCLREQVNGADLYFLPRMPHPKEASVHFRGVVTKVGRSYAVIANEHTKCKVPLTKEDIESLGELRVGKIARIHETVDIRQFIKRKAPSSRLNHRIIYPKRVKAGDDIWIAIEDQEREYENQLSIEVDPQRALLVANRQLSISGE